jgi:4-amino-4-deoxy-L-arabinose transferase-like glycosyltransferase
MYSKLILIFILGFSVSLACLLVVHISGQPIEANSYEGGKYINPAVHLLNGEGYYNSRGVYKPELERLPMYPFFICVTYWIFGLNNDLALGIMQCVMVGLIAVASSLAAYALRQQWMLITGILTALTPAIFYRASIIMPGVQFTLFVTCGIAAVLWALRGRYATTYLMLGGVSFGFALLTRPNLLFLPLFSTPVLVLALRYQLQDSWFRAIGKATLPVIIMFSLTVPWLTRNYKLTGQLVYTTQAGETALNWTYPCLANRWGCGTRKADAQAYAKIRKEELYESMTDKQKNNPAVLSKAMSKLSFELILGLPISQLFTTTIGSTVKMMMHNILYEVMLRYDITPTYITQIKGLDIKEKVNFIINIKNDKWMIGWVILQLLLVIGRAIQVVGIISFLKHHEYRWQVYWMLSVMACFMAASVGLGNNRYRIQIEPILIIFLIMGFQAIKDRFFRYRVGLPFERDS